MLLEPAALPMHPVSSGTTFVMANPYLKCILERQLTNCWFEPSTSVLELASHLNLFTLVFLISKTKSLFGTDPTAILPGALRRNTNFIVIVWNGREPRITKIQDLVNIGEWRRGAWCKLGQVQGSQQSGV